MFGKILFTVAFAALLVCSGQPLLAQNKPQAPTGPSNMVSQTVSRKSYVAPNNLEKGTLVSKKVTDKVNVDVPGLTLVCHLYGAADQGNPATNEPGNCVLPFGAKLDTSFHQMAFPTPCSGGGAVTTLTPGDVPPGIYLACDGGYYWAVIPPVKLIAEQFDNNGMVTQWGVFIGHLYCGPGGPPNGGCNVKLDVYAKLK